jgi:hypothetical protein
MAHFRGGLYTCPAFETTNLSPERGLALFGL